MTINKIADEITSTALWFNPETSSQIEYIYIYIYIYSEKRKQIIDKLRLI